MALAKTIIGQANFLMLDEPTNHLDMNSVQMLIDALSKYDGSYVLESHDRYFVSKTANKIWEIVDGKIKEFKGTYAEWEDWKKRQAANNLQAATTMADTSKEDKSAPATTVGKGAINKDVQRELQKQQKQFQQVEGQLASLKERKAGLEANMASPEIYSDKTKYAQVESEYQDVLKFLQRANEQYEKLFEKIMQLEANLVS